MFEIKDQNPVWENLYLKKNRYGTKSSNFAKDNLKSIKSINAKNLLELGCGEGRDSIFFAKEGLKVISMDFSEEAISSFKERIKNKHFEEKIKILKRDMRELLDFKDCSFDVVYSHLGLHYFADKETTKLFSEIHRILKKGGLLIFSVKSTSDYRYGRGKKIEEDIYEFSHVKHFFSKEYLLSKIRKFEIIDIKQQEEVPPEGFVRNVRNTWNVVAKKV